MSFRLLLDVIGGPHAGESIVVEGPVPPDAARLVAIIEVSGRATYARMGASGRATFARAMSRAAAATRMLSRLYLK